jgi:hypothetical protein
VHSPATACSANRRAYVLAFCDIIPVVQQVLAIILQSVDSDDVLTMDYNTILTMPTDDILQLYAPADTANGTCSTVYPYNTRASVSLHETLNKSSSSQHAAAITPLKSTAQATTPKEQMWSASPNVDDTVVYQCMCARARSHVWL